MAEVTIRAVMELPSIDPKRRGQLDTVIVYTRDDQPGQPDRVIIPISKPSEAQVTQAIKDRIAQRVAYEGKRLTI